MDNMDNIDEINSYEFETINVQNIDNTIVDLDKTTSNLDNWLEMLSEMTFKIENYCEENNLPIFNKHNKHDIVLDFFFND